MNLCPEEQKPNLHDGKAPLAGQILTIGLMMDEKCWRGLWRQKEDPKRGSAVEMMRSRN
jgi:hypothetical protein